MNKINKEQICNKLGGRLDGEFCEVELYHGTTKENAKNILKEGFKIPDRSYEWFYGKGAYFSLKPEKAREYAGMDGVVIKAKINIKIDEFCWADKIEGIGTFDQYAEEHCEDVDYEKCFENYLVLAELEQEQMIYDGCKVRSDGSQVVIHDQSILQHIKFENVI